MTSISKNVRSYKLDDLVHKYNNTYHKTIKMKPVKVKSNTYIDASKEINYKDLECIIDDIARISKYKNIFTKGYVPNCLQVFAVKKDKNALPWTYVINDLNGEEIVGAF